MSAVPPGHVRRRVIVEETRALPQDSDSRNPKHDQQSGIDSPVFALIQNLAVGHTSAPGHPPVYSITNEQLDSDTELKHDDQSRQSSDTATNVGPSSEPRPVQAAGTRTERPPATDSGPSSRPQQFDFPATTDSLAEPGPSTSADLQHRKKRKRYRKQRKAAPPTRTERPPATDSRPSRRPQQSNFSAATVAEQRSSTSKKEVPTRRKQRTAAPPAEQSAACAFPPECEPAGRGAVYDFTRTNDGKGS